ncbi:apolipoprotein N-acyltransferase [Glaciimonas soli]|uniref:Apolipoprotein N-acyltransferase n=1 Tax=Glaciimonas soli TaxID=2590999 RepID=A0A843YQM5_9BURK|nr:apolipoprotein N-acyltransferase [Glaciimonas soli]MQR01835.1 apolipoprotein N-acyltransferase [Glaciimonas soli]
MMARHSIFSAPLKLSLLLPLIALIGATNAFAFAPFGLWPIQILTLACLVWLLIRIDSAKRGALLGWAYGFGWAMGGIHWLYISLHDYGGMPAWITICAISLMALAVGLYASLAAALTVWLRQRWSASPTLLTLLIFPAVWGLSEWLRGWLLTGFPWLISGYAHTASPLAGFAPLLGVYGVGTISAFIAGCLVLRFQIQTLQRKLPTVIAVLILFAGVALHKVEWTLPSGNAISVRLLQGNVPQETKFDPVHINDSLQLYANMITAAPADLIATPESAVPLFQTQLPPDYLPALASFAQKSGSTIALGIPLVSQHNDGITYTNSLLGISPAPSQTNQADYRYDKQHLLPFGEFIPYGFRWFVNLMNIPLGDFNRGAKVQAPFAVKDQWVLPNICYEDLFGEEIAGQLGDARSKNQPMATLLLNISNLGWFGNTIALPQHLQVSQMRALETGRPMLRSTNTGATAVIDPHGKVLSQLPFLTLGTLTTSVQGYSGTTPYILWGNWMMLLLSILMLVAGWWISRRTQP